MTHVLRVRNVETAMGEGFQWLKVAGVPAASRNGPVLVAPGPVITEYERPRERVVFNPARDANPVFHLLESIWMLAGAENVGFLLPYNARMAEYAEPNGAMHGAYGHRWRYRFGANQIIEVIELLTKNTDSRRAVMQMWSAKADLGATKRDLPCNTHIYLSLKEGTLDMTVCCRSNDALWGAYGANAVHFSMLQELIAAGVGVEVGVYRQFSNNFHVYTENETVKRWLDLPPHYEGGYPHRVVPMIGHGETVRDFLYDCECMVYGPANAWRTAFFHRVVAPLKHVYDARKRGAKTWRGMLDGVAECDWKDSFIEWANRRDK